MRQLYIDGKPAVIKSGTSFKFYRENIYFTDAEDYTLDVTLPLQGCPENLAIFSAIHRPEMSAVHLIGKKYPFHFIAPPLDIEGSAIVTEINEMEVKVQLLAGATGIGYDTIDSLGHDVYIDELDLGEAFDVTHPGISVYDGTGEGTWHNSKNIEDIHCTYDNSPDKCVCFPVYSEENDTIINKHLFIDPSYGDSDQYHPHWWYFAEFSAQPYLLLIIERILRAIGYELNPDNAIAKSWQRNIFIANGRNEFKYANILPHWTVREFLKEVSMFCGVSFTVENKTVNAIRNAGSHYSNVEYVVINDIIDEHTTEIMDKDEGNKDPLSGNVGYDFDSIDPMLQLPDEVWRKANVIAPFYNESSMRQYAGAYSEAKSDWILSEKQNHGVYTFIEDSEGFFLCEVDQVGSIFRDATRREIDVTLRIVPSKMIMKPIDYMWLIGYTGEQRWDFITENAFYAPMLATSGPTGKMAERFSVNNAVNPYAEANNEPSKPERIEVAYYDGGKINLGSWEVPNSEQQKVNVSFYLPTGIPYVREDESYFRDLFTNTGTHKNLLLKEGLPMYDILSSAEKIDTRVRHSYQFIDNIVYDPKAIFIIRGRKYACQKIEFNIEENGVSPIKRGYFYEIND